MYIPEVVLFKTLNTIIDIVNNDWEIYKNDPTKSLLYNMFNEDSSGNKLVINKFNYFDQAKAILIKNRGDVRKLEVSFGYNLERKGLPSIHILLPNESKFEMGIGIDQGYVEDHYDETDHTSSPVFTYPFTASYNLMFTSDNSSEVILVYHFFKSMLIALMEHLEFSGLRNISFSGQDLQLSNDLAPQGVFHRNLMVSFFYENSVKSLNPEKLAKYVEVVGKAVIE